MTSIGVSAFAMVRELRPVGPPATQPATATVAHSAAGTTTRRCLVTTLLFKFPREAIADLKLEAHNGEGRNLWFTPRPVPVTGLPLATKQLSQREACAVVTT